MIQENESNKTNDIPLAISSIKWVGSCAKSNGLPPLSQMIQENERVVGCQLKFHRVNSPKIARHSTGIPIFVGPLRIHDRLDEKSTSAWMA